LFIKIPTNYNTSRSAYQYNKCTKPPKCEGTRNFLIIIET